MKISTFVWIIIILVLLGVGWYVYNGSTTPTLQTAPTDTTQNSAAPIVSTNPSDTTQDQSAPMTATVTYGPNGFSPATVTIAKGGTVTFTNQGGSNMWVASGPHPTHEGYSGTTKNQHCPDTAGGAFDQCAVGASYSFVFQKVGTWNYHNHVNASDRGTIIVQ